MTIDQAFQQAVTHHRCGRLSEASTLYQQVLLQEPNHVNAIQMLGVLTNQLGRPEEAISLLCRAVRLDPANASAQSNLGLVLAGRERFDEAAAAFQQALALRPDLADAHNNLGNVRKSQGRSEEAIAIYKRAIELRADFADAWMNLGTVLWETGRPFEAVLCFKRLTGFNPPHFDAHLSLAGALRDSGRMDESVSAGVRAVGMRPDSEDARFSLALTRLHQGDFARGWNDFESYWDRRLGRDEYRGIPAWTGEALNGRRILLHLHHGFGDTLQLIRYAPLITAAGGQVVLRCQKELTGILSSVAGVAQIVSHDDPIPPADVQCSLLALPRVFKTNLQSIPASVPYLKPDPARVHMWANRLSKEPPGLKIGLNWAGSPLFREDRFRSMNLQTLAPLAGIKNVSLYSLQKGVAAEQLRNPPPGLNIVDWTRDLGDFADTAALMANLDLIVSSDTSVVHLAGALAKPIWVLLHFVPGCFWLLDRPDSPWYPTMRLFRQPAPGDWSSAVGQVASALGDWARSL